MKASIQSLSEVEAVESFASIQPMVSLIYTTFSVHATMLAKSARQILTVGGAKYLVLI